MIHFQQIYKNIECESCNDTGIILDIHGEQLPCSCSEGKDVLKVRAMEVEVKSPHASWF